MKPDHVKLYLLYDIVKPYDWDETLKTLERLVCSGEVDKGNAAKYDVEPNLIQSIIYEEQTHNKTPVLETNSFVHSVGPMAVSEKNWGNHTRSEMLDPVINIDVGISLLADSIQRVNEKNPDAGVAQYASHYNLQTAVTVITDYGKRLELFYNWFGEHYAE